MLRISLVFVLVLAACAPGDRDQREGDDTEEVPIGPGSDSTTLIPPDTPMTRREPSRPPRSMPDSLASTTR